MDILSQILLAALALTALFIAAKFFTTPQKRFLVFSSVGDSNNVKSWLSDPDKRIFDLVIYYYGDNNRLDIDADLVIKRKGLKLENFYHFLTNNRIDQYKAIWLADDDIIIDTDSINQMFVIFDRYKLWLAQPSYDHESRISHPVTRVNDRCILRYTNFVEVGVPIFSTGILHRLRESFSGASTGACLDYIWTDLLNYPKDKIAIIDAISCQHPDNDYSALDQIMPRSLHITQGAALLKKHHLIPDDWRPLKKDHWPIPFEIEEYSQVHKTEKARQC